MIGGRSFASESGADGGLEIGLRIGGNEAGESAVADDIHRLEAVAEAEPLKARPMSEVGPAEPEEVLERRKKKWGLGQWTGWMSVASAVLTVAAVAAVLLARKAPEAEPDQAAFRFEEEKRLDERSEYFVANSGELIAEAEKVMTRFAAASSMEQALRRVRDSQRVKEQMRRLWRPWGSNPAFAPGEDPVSYIRTEPRLVVCIDGHRGDFSPFQLRFVQEGGKLVLDWEASFAVGEVQISELADDGSTEGGLLRSLVRPATYFSRAFPEDRFRSYQLLDPSGEHYIWAYAPLDSPVAAALVEEFNEGSVLLKQDEEARATLRISGPVEGGAKCFMITEMLHKGWVSP